MSGSINALFLRSPLDQSLLYNSLDYGLDYVVVLEEDDGYRLVVRNYGSTLFAKSYTNITEARAAFLKHFSFTANDGTPAVRPKWTNFFNDDWDYLTLCFINQISIIQ